MTTELIKLDAPELATIDKSKAEQIRAVFAPMVQMLDEFENAYNEVISEAEKEITNDVMAKAKRVRLDIAKIRISAEKVRKEQKEEYLRAGKAIDGVNNILKWAVVEKENKLEEIEKYYENQEKERLENLQADRVEMLAPYVEDAHERRLCDMEEDVWNAYFSAKKKEFDDRVEAERQAERERIEREAAEKLHNERKAALLPFYEFWEPDYQTLGFDSLTENQFADILSSLQQKKSDHDKEQEKIRKENERLKREAENKKAEEERERIRREAKERAEREAHQKQLDAERAEREEIARKLKEKEDQEKREREEAEARKQAELSKGDADKVQDLINDLNVLKAKYTFESAKYIETYKQVGILIDKVIGYVTK